MHTLDLLPHLPALTAPEAAGWMEATIAQAKALRQHDSRLYPLTSDPVAMDTAKRLHEAWAQWAADAEILLARSPAPQPGQADDASNELRVHLGYARALQRMPPEEILRRQLRVSSGEAKLFTTEEARRELGLAPRR